MKNSIRQALMELKGKPFKSLLIAAVVIVMVIFCGLATFFRSSVNSFYQSFADMSGYSVVAEIDPYHEWKDWSSIIEKAEENKHIVGYNNTYQAFQLCQPVNFSNVPYDGAATDNNADMVYICGNINAEYNEYFRNEFFKLTEGYFPLEEDGGIVIDAALASKNHLKTGDVLVLEYNGNRKDIPIVGIYEVLRVPKMEVLNGYYEVCANSILFCSYGSYVELTGKSEYSIISFYVDDYDNMENCCRHIEELVSSTGEDSVVFNAIAVQEIQMSDVIALLRRLTTLATKMVFVLCVGIMSLLILLWLRGHSRMIAIYQILGQSPIYVMRLLLMEILFVTIPSAGFTTGLMSVLINRYSKEMFDHLLDFCEIQDWQMSFSERVWNFKMNQTMLIEQIVLMELIILVIVVVGSMIMTRKSVRELRQME